MRWWRGWSRRRLHCQVCGSRYQRVIYAGLPGKICPSCTLFVGLAALYADLFGFDGVLFQYDGSYWKALWAWLHGNPDS